MRSHLFLHVLFLFLYLIFQYLFCSIKTILRWIIYSLIKINTIYGIYLLRAWMWWIRNSNYILIVIWLLKEIKYIKINSFSLSIFLKVSLNIPFIVFSVSFCSVLSLSLQLFTSSVNFPLHLSNIHGHIWGGLVSFRNEFSLFLNTLLSFGKTYFAILKRLRFSLSHFPSPSVTTRSDH